MLVTLRGHCALMSGMKLPSSFSRVLKLPKGWKELDDVVKAINSISLEFFYLPLSPLSFLSVLSVEKKKRN